MENYKILNLQSISDDRGSLVVLENLKQVPFEIKRIFYVYNAQSDVPRGAHANKKSQFVFIAINGSIKIKIKEKSGVDKIFNLNNPNTALWIDKLVWKEMYDFSDSAVLLVLSNELYDPDEYINDFAKLRGNH
ncbi:sugar 3,4-ketoisomerase [Gilliamella sp. B2838]|uniref:sugar 3,4-ketoisomerase n=1 Tax=Gilliamella sp. B2838 TaxID=2818020 RepID=UPI002269CE7C|nr:FdtA/QdtA family cupin domain-containing protein [Gilliamella sp. B2838]MCX8726412.1 FdtA/QdtA family cupin domain-containing protein [Gilliamella sp. B2838]